MFSALSDYLTYTVFAIEKGSALGNSVHFFIEDITKIFILVISMIYLIGFLRAGLDTQKVKEYLKGKPRFVGYTIAALFGAITPFCSCSSIPFFLAFTSAGIPLGITMAFLISSPMINEVAIALLGSLLGVQFTILYILTGLTAGIIGGAFLDAIGADRYLSDLGNKAKGISPANFTDSSMPARLTLNERHLFARNEVATILARIWKWIILGITIGAAIHGYVPQSFILEHLGTGAWWSVPLAVFAGIPLYANASGIIPIAESLLNKGLPIGTTMAFMMSVVAASLPEFILLKQVMKPQLLLIFFSMLLVYFTLAGWLFNLIF